MTQKEALDILKTGRNVFLTGAAGSGKTHTLREYISYLKDLNAEVAITASTGIAATHMGGMTIHSWSGLGIRDSLHPYELEEIAEKPHVRSRVKNASVLIIDEVSMLDSIRLDLIDQVLQRVRQSVEPFGGIQVILCGDFFQLPPIQKVRNFNVEEENQEATLDFYEPVTTPKNNSLFAYNSPVWKSLGLKICYLEEQHRQEDLEYLKVLNAIRDNMVSEETIEILNRRLDADIGSFAPTKLYSHNVNVDSENGLELGKLSNELFVYNMESRGARNLVEALKKSCLAPETLRLKRGAKVMFVKNNFEEGFVNGTLGEVDRLDKDGIVVRTTKGVLIDVPLETWRIEEHGSVKAEIAQFPLRLAWAITVHKSQGMSLDAAEVDLRDCFERGMGYVALSRVRSLNGLSLKGFNNTALQVSEEVLNFDESLRKLSNINRVQIEKLGEKLLALQKEFKEKISNEADEASPTSPSLRQGSGGQARLRRARKKKPKVDTLSETKKLFQEGKKLKDIAKERGLKEGTVLDHLEKIKLQEPSFNLYTLRESIPASKYKKIYSAFQKVGTSDGGKRPLTPVRDLLGDKFSFEELRLVRMLL